MYALQLSSGLPVSDCRRMVNLQLTQARPSR